MKNILKIISAMMLMIIMVSCATTSKMDNPEVINLLDNGAFTFVAERASPTSADVTNVMNSMSNGSTSRILNLDPGYTIILTKDEMDVVLPYFGTMYKANFGGNNSFRFTSKDFTVNQSKGKKGSSIFNIIPKDQRNINNIIMEVFRNGKAYVSINANDRQPISYDGYLMKNEKVKK